ncbi:hypothetical protein J437_LFUL007050, partial [Ladona fulva]
MINLATAQVEYSEDQQAMVKVPNTFSLPAVRVQRRQRRVLDTSSTYVRGEENLEGWRPRGDSLIFDHQWELEKLTRLEEVERVRHLLLLRERLGVDKHPLPTSIRGINTQHRSPHDFTKSEKEVCNMVAKATNEGRASPTALVAAAQNVGSGINSSPIAPTKDKDVYEPWEMTERERQLAVKCIKLILGRIPSKEMPIPKQGNDSSPGEESSVTLSNSMADSMTSSLLSNTSMSQDMTSPEKMMNFFQTSTPMGVCNSPQMGQQTQHQLLSQGMGLGSSALSCCSPSREHQRPLVLFVAEMEEIRVSPVVSRKGYLNILEENTNGWKKRWVV